MKKIYKSFLVFILSVSLLFPTITYANSNDTMSIHDPDTENLFNQMFTSLQVEKISYGYVIRVKVVDNYWARFKCDDMFNVLIYKLKSRNELKYFDNLQTIEDQFECHYQYAPNKRPWNLEGWRPNGAGLSNTCNPGEP